MNFSTFSDVFERVRTRSDAFGCVRMRSDAIGWVPVRLEAFGHVWNFSDFLKNFDDFDKFWTFFDLGGLLLWRNTYPRGQLLQGLTTQALH